MMTTVPTSRQSRRRALGVATIGYAFRGKVHSNAWRNVAGHLDVPAFEQKVLVGRDAAQVAEAAAKYGWAQPVTDWRSVIARDDIDIVDICARGSMHAEIAIAALEAGKHVLVEIPLATTVTEAEAMVAAAAAARTRGVQSMIDFNYRRIPALALARELIAEGRLGTIRHIRAEYRQDRQDRQDRPFDAGGPTTWPFCNETARFGVMSGIASHAIDQIQYLTGQTILEASGVLKTLTTRHPGPDGMEDVAVDNSARATFWLSGEMGASVEASRLATGQQKSLQIEVYGTEGALTFNLENLNQLNFFDSTAPVRDQGLRRTFVNESEQPYIEARWPQDALIDWEHIFTHQIRDFLLAIQSGSPPSPRFEEGLQIQRVLAAIETSAINKSTVTRV